MFFVVAVVVAILLGAFALRRMRHRRRLRHDRWHATQHTLNGRVIIQIERYGEETQIIDAIPINEGNYAQRKSKAEDRAYERIADLNSSERALRR